MGIGHPQPDGAILEFDTRRGSVGASKPVGVGHYVQVGESGMKRKPISSLGLHAIRSNDEIAAEMNRRNPGFRCNAKSVAACRCVAEKKLRDRLLSIPEIRELLQGNVADGL